MTALTGHPFFLAGLTLLLVHEMDAIRCHEWRIFPGLSALPDRLGLRLFVALHVPVVFLVLWGLASGSRQMVYWLDVFFVAHLALHLLYLRHPRNEFRDALSWSLIAGAALFGALDLF